MLSTHPRKGNQEARQRANEYYRPDPVNLFQTDTKGVLRSVTTVDEKYDQNVADSAEREIEPENPALNSLASNQTSAILQRANPSDVLCETSSQNWARNCTS